MNYLCGKSKLAGEIIAPPSKSHTLRAILFASLARGKSSIENYLKSPDAIAMINACKSMGATIKVRNKKLSINGVAGNPLCVDNIVDVGNSGQVLRFFSAIMTLQSKYTIFTGDQSIRHNRPMQPLIDGLSDLGAFCVSSKQDGFAPIIVKGPVQSGVARLAGEDSQPVSALLILSSFLNGKTEIIVENPGERAWIDLTLHWLDKIGVKYHNKNYCHYIVESMPQIYEGFNYIVPGDFSSILFPITAALITGSKISLLGVDMNDVQGDKKVIDLFKKMGAKIKFDSRNNMLNIYKSDELTGLEIDVNDYIDAVPILAVLGCFVKGRTVIKNASIARKKECDRIKSITKELKKMGAKIKERGDGMVIEKSVLKGCNVDTYSDHRMVMALSIAAMASDGKTIINDVASVSKSYPDFYDDMKRLGANIVVKT